MSTSSLLYKNKPTEQAKCIIYLITTTWEFRLGEWRPTLRTNVVAALCVRMPSGHEKQGLVASYRLHIQTTHTGRTPLCGVNRQCQRIRYINFLLLLLLYTKPLRYRGSWVLFEKLPLGTAIVDISHYWKIDGQASIKPHRYHRFCLCPINMKYS